MGRVRVSLNAINLKQIIMSYMEIKVARAEKVLYLVLFTLAVMREYLER